MFERIEINADQTKGPFSVAVTRRIKRGCKRAYDQLTFSSFSPHARS